MIEAETQKPLPPPLVPAPDPAPAPASAPFPSLNSYWPTALAF